MHVSADEARSDRTFWRGMYLIAFAIGAIVPIASIIAAAAVTEETAWRNDYFRVDDDEAHGPNIDWRLEALPDDNPRAENAKYRLYDGRPAEYRAYVRRHVEGPLLLLGLAWSGATLIGIAGVTAGAWIVVATGERLGIDRARGYLRGMFLMAFATGALAPLAALIAAGVITTDSPRDISEKGTALLIVMWCGMIAVCIAGLFSAAWLVKTAAGKLRPVDAANSLSQIYQPEYAAELAGQQRGGGM